MAFFLSPYFFFGIAGLLLLGIIVSPYIEKRWRKSPEVGPRRGGQNAGAYKVPNSRLANIEPTMESAGRAKRGADAAAAGREFLRREYGSDKAIRQAMVKPKRNKQS